MNNKKQRRKKEMIPEEQLKRLGERLRELRKKTGYTSLEIFAYEHGFSKTQYGRYENGEDLRMSTLIRVVNCFGIDLKEFFSEGFD